MSKEPRTQSEKALKRLAEEVVQLKAEMQLIHSTMCALLMSANQRTYDSVVRSLRLVRTGQSQVGPQRSDVMLGAIASLLEEIEEYRRRVLS